ncbi:MAG: T9SS type A sorting domain-containing protein, partial [Bacteroidales bacterium]|nr:T9SS type A sorting domain-containing protein [Bacteroidales bacterium]
YSKLEMTITPNPSHGNFFIDFSAEDYYEVFVYDMTGHIVYDSKLSNNNNLLDLSHLENGIYIVKASNGMTQIKERVVIQK